MIVKVSLHCPDQKILFSPRRLENNRTLSGSSIKTQFKPLTQVNNKSYYTPVTFSEHGQKLE